MGGICRLHPALHLAHLKVVFLDNVIEAVVANTSWRTKFLLLHEPKLVAANARVFLADILDELHHESFLGSLYHCAVAMFVVGLLSYTN